MLQRLLACAFSLTSCDIASAAYRTFQTFILSLILIFWALSVGCFVFLASHHARPCFIIRNLGILHGWCGMGPHEEGDQRLGIFSYDSLTSVQSWLVLLRFGEASSSKSACFNSEKSERRRFLATCKGSRTNLIF